MGKTTCRVLTLTVSCLLLLSIITQRVMAWPCPPCPDCETCTETGCECQAECGCGGKICPDCYNCENCNCVYVGDPPCALIPWGIEDTTYCNCVQIPPDEYRMCHGGGQRTYYYICDGCCPECYECQPSGTETVLLESYPNPCEDVGWWPPGPECNEASDCQITGWYDYYGPHHSCACILVCV